MNEGLSETNARHKAETHFSWHLPMCAADFRSSGERYSPPDVARILFWMKSRYQSPMWEVLSHDAGTGLHFHLGHRDFEWRRKWEHQTRPGVA